MLNRSSGEFQQKTGGKDANIDSSSDAGQSMVIIGPRRAEASSGRLNSCTSVAMDLSSLGIKYARNLRAASISSGNGTQRIGHRQRSAAGNPHPKIYLPGCLRRPRRGLSFWTLGFHIRFPSLNKTNTAKASVITFLYATRTLSAFFTVARRRREWKRRIISKVNVKRSTLMIQNCSAEPE